MKIKLLGTVDGIGNDGDVLDVSEPRAARWIAKGYASALVGDFQTPEEHGFGVDDPSAELPKRGRPRKVR